MTIFVPAHDHGKRTLVRELTRRIRNDLLSSINIVSAAAVRADHPEVKIALANVVELLERHADVHRFLTVPDRDGLIDAAEYMRKLVFAISRSSLEPLGIHLALDADTLPLGAERCWRLALVVHELVTNAARHACFDGRDGAIKVRLSLTDTVVNCIVADNGSRSSPVRRGRGLTVVGDLASSLGGRLEYGFGAQFSSFLLVFPLTERELLAHRLVASRRARGERRRRAVRAQPVSAAHIRAGEPQRADLSKTESVSEAI